LRGKREEVKYDGSKRRRARGPPRIRKKSERGKCTTHGSEEIEKGDDSPIHRSEKK